MRFVAQPISWKAFVVLAAGSAAFIVLAIFLFIAAVNPYGNLPVSLSFERQRVTANERYAFPGLLRSDVYDSAVLGTSTVMLLHPHKLNAVMGGQFVNLAMGSATPFEQLQMLDLFRRTQHPRRIVAAIDTDWCHPERRADRLTFRPFPPWMYDDNRWDDYLHMLNDRALAHAIRLVAIKLGLVHSEFGPDGYFQFVPDTAKYNLAKARAKIYDTSAPSDSVTTDLAVLRAAERPFSEAPYYDLADLFAAIDNLPSSTETMLMFVPYHFSMFATPLSWADWSDCKQAVVRGAAQRQSLTVVDFMRPSPLTVADSNYWDALHYTVEQADNIARDLGQVARGQNEGAFYRVLHRPGWTFDGRLK